MIFFNLIVSAPIFGLIPFCHKMCICMLHVLRLCSRYLGVFNIADHRSLLTVCPRHRKVCGLGWKSGKVRCSVPSQLAGHKSSSAQADRGINSKESAYILSTGRAFLPCGTRECNFLYWLSDVFRGLLIERWKRSGSSCSKGGIALSIDKALSTDNSIYFDTTYRRDSDLSSG